MKKISLLFCLSTLSVSAALPSSSMPPMGGMPSSQSLFENEQNLVINNRVLLKINGKPLTVMDVVRKMDLIFYRQFPELATTPAARYQFYTSSWEMMLNAVIDDALIVADAEEKGVEISEGEVREELEMLFGPDVVFNLDQMDLTLPEAMDMLKRELTVQRMNMMMVRSRAMTEAKPKQVRARYDQLLKENPPQNEWVYRVLSIRGEAHQKAANEAAKLLNEQQLPFEEVVSIIAEKPDVEVSLSDQFERDEASISLAHKAVLQTLSAGANSTPLVSDTVSRIFCLKEYKVGEATSFNSVADEIRGAIVQEISETHNEAYRKKLRRHYGVTDRYLKRVIPDNFVPFALK